MNKLIAIILLISSFFFLPNLEAKDNKSPKEGEKDLIVTATPSNFDELTSKGIVFVDFWAAWCAPCRRMNPILKDVAAEREGVVTIAKLNVDHYHEFSTKMRVFNLPTIIIYKDGRELTRAEGLLTKQKLLEVIDYLHSVKE